MFCVISRHQSAAAMCYKDGGAGVQPGVAGGIGVSVELSEVGDNESGLFARLAGGGLFQ